MSPSRFHQSVHCLPTLCRVSSFQVELSSHRSHYCRIPSPSPPATCLLCLVLIVSPYWPLQRSLSSPETAARVHNDRGGKGFPVGCQPSADSGLRQRKLTFLAQALAFQQNHNLRKLLACALGRTYGVENKTVGMGSLQAPQGKGLVLSTGAASTRALWFWSPCEPRTKGT